MTSKLLTDHNLEFLAYKEAAQACLSLHVSKCDIVGNHMSRFVFTSTTQTAPKQHQLQLQLMMHALLTPYTTSFSSKIYCSLEF